jgi:hypothetical protein
VTLRYLEGAAAVAVVLLSVSTTARRVQQIICPRWSGAPRQLLLYIIGIASVIVTAEVLGLFQLFRLLPYLVANVAVATTAHRLARRHAIDEDSEPRRIAVGAVSMRVVPWWEPASALAAVALVVAEWAPGTVEAYRTGMTSIDSLWYHMPFAAQFAQSGSITSLHNINNDNTVGFYPASSEMVHAVGIVLFGNDLLSPIVNLGWLALALLGGWCIGIRFGVPCLTLMAVACVMGSTELVADEPGSAYNDVVGIALVLAILAIMGNVDRPWGLRSGDRSLMVAAMAAGLAVGVKYPFSFPVLGLTVCVIAGAPKGRRVWNGLGWFTAAGLTGGVWYARNFIDTSNPLPNLRIALGPLRLPSAPSSPTFSVAHFLTDGSAWRDFFYPGFGEAFGPAGVPLLVMAVAGLLVNIFARPRSRKEKAFVRAIGVCGVFTLVGYLVTPEPNLPSSFVYDLRFMAVAVALGLIALPIMLCRYQWVALAAGVFGLILVTEQFARGIWSAGPSLVAYHSLAVGLTACAIAIVIGAGAIGLRRHGPRRLVIPPIAAITLITALVVSGAFVQSFYLTHRYMSGSQAPVYKWADTVHHARIGVSGLILNYPLYGNDLTNEVTFVGDRTSQDYYSSPSSCVDWRDAVNAGHFQFVVTIALLEESPRLKELTADGWTRSDRVAHLVATAIAIGIDGYVRTDVFAIRGRLDPGTCGSR